MREHTTAAAPPRDAMFARLHQSLRPRQRQCLRYCEAEGFRGLKLTTSSKFHDPAHAAQDRGAVAGLPFGRHVAVPILPQHEVACHVDARPWLPGVNMTQLG